MARSDDWLAPLDAAAFDREAAVHLLRRAALGHPPAAVDAMLELGPQGAARALVRGEAADAREQSLDNEQGAILALDSGKALAGWWWARLLWTRHPLRARMSLFWHDHFATSIRKVLAPHWMAEQIATFERFGLGKFKPLVVAVSKGPAMLRWLDNDKNRKGRANENFARELFELFTLGRDHYTEDDIKESARAFTGWRILREGFFFDRKRHDDGVKTVLGKTGRLGGEDVIDIALARDDCARFIGDKLLAAFVGPDCPAAAQSAFAKLLRANDLDVGASLGVLLGSRLFHDAVHRGTRIRGPVEWIVWFLRTLEASAAPAALANAAGAMGQTLLDPPNVSGWDEEESWVSSAAWLLRANFAGRVGRRGGPFWLRPSLVELVPEAAPEAELAWLVERFVPAGLAPETRDALGRQVRAERQLPREVRLPGVLRALLMLPEAHRF